MIDTSRKLQLFNESHHNPVMVKEMLEWLEPKIDGLYIDATWGRGGYTKAILEQAQCKVLGFDHDPQAFYFAKLYNKFINLQDNNFELKAINNSDIRNIPEQELASNITGPRFWFYPHSFVNLEEGIKKYFSNYDGIDAIVFDLGLSSPQLEITARGFSFNRDGPLDMRMNLQGQTASEWINNSEEKSIADTLYIYGGERKSRKIAKAIIQERKKEQITKTLQLVKIIHKSIGSKSGKIDSATRTFQAIRIFINQELQQLQTALIAALPCLKKLGKIIVVSYHSGEDRIVKQLFRKACGYESNTNSPFQLLPNPKKEKSDYILSVKKIIRPSFDEIKKNPRARSAKMRIIQRISSRSAIS